MDISHMYTVAIVISDTLILFESIVTSITLLPLLSFTNSLIGHFLTCIPFINKFVIESCSEHFTFNIAISFRVLVEFFTLR